MALLLMLGLERSLELYSRKSSAFLPSKFDICLKTTSRMLAVPSMMMAPSAQR